MSTPAPTTKEDQSAEDIALIYSVSPRTIQRLAEKGKIPAIRIGTNWRFDKEAVAAALATSNRYRSK